MRITWVIEDHGSDEATAETADGAAEALAAGVRQAYRDYDTATVAHVMLNVVAPLRMQLVTDGRFEVERGRTWEARIGGIFVTLSPN
ncbi:hypothetical protein SEA_SHAWTY_52 [Streptomyces phage Shawty]|uniref:Uncharacterized protein n=1 Tax=Streptomyces phage Shawty TaxID=2510521 RepID=A0A411CYV4_9CAUD|nr:hypothetical protein SEA_SHAWTY_52 [Streptomyces phage Shawty]